jgi:hypothetical protein
LSRVQEGGELSNIVTFPCWSDSQQVCEEVLRDEKLRI